MTAIEAHDLSESAEGPQVSATGMRPATVLLAGDQALLRCTLESYLQQSPAVCVVGSAGNTDEVVAEAIRLDPDVLVVDVDMPAAISAGAIRLVRRRCPRTRIVLLGVSFSDRLLEEAVAVQAAGCVSKREPPDRVIAAIRGAVSGSPYFAAEVRSRLVVAADGIRLTGGSERSAGRLTVREREVLGYLARGLSKKEIAPRMHLSVNTVNRHTDNIMRKLDIHDRVQLACFAIREGLADPAAG